MLYISDKCHNSKLMHSFTRPLHALRVGRRGPTYGEVLQTLCQLLLRLLLELVHPLVEQDVRVPPFLQLPVLHSAVVIVLVQNSALTKSLSNHHINGAQGASNLSRDNTRQATDYGCSSLITPQHNHNIDYLYYFTHTLIYC